MRPGRKKQRERRELKSRRIKWQSNRLLQTKAPPSQSQTISEQTLTENQISLWSEEEEILSLSDLITQVCSAPLCLFLFVSWNLWFLTDWLIINFFFYCSAYLLFADRLVLGVLFFLILKAPLFCCSFMDFFFKI